MASNWTCAVTSDRQLVVFHDRGLKRITGRRGLVSNVTLEEMRGLDVGSQFAPGVLRRASPHPG